MTGSIGRSALWGLFFLFSGYVTELLIGSGISQVIVYASPIVFCLGLGVLLGLGRQVSVIIMGLLGCLIWTCAYWTCVMLYDTGKPLAFMTAGALGGVALAGLSGLLNPRFRSLRLALFAALAGAVGGIAFLANDTRDTKQSMMWAFSAWQLLVGMVFVFWKTVKRSTA